jgi:hypothetical protein
VSGLITVIEADVVASPIIIKVCPLHLAHD